MSNFEDDIEKVRQAIMRYRELLDLMKLTLDKSEENYAALFPADIPQDMPEKDCQWLAAEKLIGELEPLTRALLRLRLASRDFERDFEQVYDNLMVE